MPLGRSGTPAPAAAGTGTLGQQVVPRLRSAGHDVRVLSPAIVAQAAATLSEMFPGRFWLALGSGEASNEHITGDRWPPRPGEGNDK